MLLLWLAIEDPAALAIYTQMFWPSGLWLSQQSSWESGACAAVSIIPLGSCSGGGLSGRTAAAAGSCWSCWLSQECSLLGRRLGYYVANCAWPRREREKKAWKEVVLRPPLSAGKAGPVGVAWEFAFYDSRRRRWARSGGGRGGGRSWTERMVSFASLRRLLAGPGDGGGGGALSWNESSLSAPLAADFGSGPEVATGGCAVNGEFAFYASCRRLRAWPGGGGWRVRSWKGSSLPTPLASDFGPGPEGAAERRSAGRGIRFLRLSPPARAWPGPSPGERSGGGAAFSFYASRRRLRAWPGGGSGALRRDAQLDRKFAFYTFQARRRLRAQSGGGGGEGRSWTGFLSPPTSGLARRRCGGRALSWTGSSLSTPLAPDFGPGPEAPAERHSAGQGVRFLRPSPPTSGPEVAAEGCAAGREVCFLRLSPPTSGLAREGAAEGCEAWRGVCFLHLSPPILGPTRRGRRRGAQVDWASESLAFRCTTEMINRSLNDLSTVFLDHCQQQQVWTFLRIRIRCHFRSSGYCLRNLQTLAYVCRTWPF